MRCTKAFICSDVKQFASQVKIKKHFYSVPRFERNVLHFAHKLSRLLDRGVSFRRRVQNSLHTQTLPKLNFTLKPQRCSIFANNPEFESERRKGPTTSLLLHLEKNKFNSSGLHLLGNSITVSNRATKSWRMFHKTYVMSFNPYEAMFSACIKRQWSMRYKTKKLIYAVFFLCSNLFMNR